MRSGLDHHQVFQLQTRESIRAYVRELAGWDKRTATDALLVALKQIESAKNDPELAADLLAAEPKDLDGLLNGASIETPFERNLTAESDAAK